MLCIKEIWLPFYCQFEYAAVQPQVRVSFWGGEEDSNLTFKKYFVSFKMSC